MGTAAEVGERGGGGGSIEAALAAGLEKDFEPRGDMPTIQDIVDVKDLINYVQNMKQVYTQVSMDDILRALALLRAPEPASSDAADPRKQAKAAVDPKDVEHVAGLMIRLMSQDKLGSAHSVKIDERSRTLIFEDPEVQFSLLDKEKQSATMKSQYIETAKCLSTIEQQNLRLVNVLDQVHQTSREIKLSNEYAAVKINHALGRKPDPDHDFGGGYDMNAMFPGDGQDDMLDEDDLLDAERAH